MSNASIDAFRESIEARGHAISDADWDSLKPPLKPVSVARGEVLLDSAHVAQHVIFVCQGVVASLQTTADGDTQIARFFERGQLCTNITSAWHQSITEDELVAMTDVSGLLIPFSMFRHDFMFSGPLSHYWREMVIETLLFDKDLMCTKTMRDVATRYRFLSERYEQVVTTVPDKYIARFLGITPQGLSRFLRNNRPELT